jgi:hypothetical protein
MATPHAGGIWVLITKGLERGVLILTYEAVPGKHDWSTAWIQNSVFSVVLLGFPLFCSQIERGQLTGGQLYPPGG